MKTDSDNQVVEAMNPKVFVSHASEDKERFVIDFAKKLRAKGIDAWLDRWEMYPGDSLVDKIFEEGIKNAQAIIIVVSKHSVGKPWVKEELNASVVKRINMGNLLIPVVIDDCEVPEALKSTLWSRIADVANYDKEFERIVAAIFNCREKPPLGSPPKYTTLTVDSLSDLTEIDTLIFLRACEERLAKDENGIDAVELLKAMAELEIPEQEFHESIEILDGKHYIKAAKLFGGSIPFFNITHFGFDLYLRRIFSGYDAIYDQVCLVILNEKLTANDEIAKRLGQPFSIVDHIFEDLSNRGLVGGRHFYGGGQKIFEIPPELQRLYRKK